MYNDCVVLIISWSFHHIWIVIESSPIFQIVYLILIPWKISTYFFRSRNVVSSAWMPGLPSRSVATWRFEPLTTVKPLSVWLRRWLRAILIPFNQVPWCAFSRRFFFLGGVEPRAMPDGLIQHFFWDLYCSEVVLFWVASNIKKMSKYINITLQPSDFSAPKLPFL